jgi:hypothetical protein
MEIKSLLNIKKLAFKIFYMILLCSISSCEISEHVPISKIPGTQNQHTNIYIEGRFTSELTYQFVNITSIAKIGEEVSKITNAHVQVFVGDSVYDFIHSTQHMHIPESEKNEGKYVSVNKCKGSIGAVHTITVTYNNDTYTAHDIMIPVTPFAFEGNNLPKRTRYDNYILGGLYYSQPETYILEWQYYDWWGYDENDNDMFRLEKAYSYFFKDFINPEYHELMYYYFYGNAWDLDKNAQIKITKHSISEEYNKYLYQLIFQQQFAVGFFHSSPANIHTNFSAGAIGFFAATDVYIKELTFQEFNELEYIQIQ